MTKNQSSNYWNPGVLERIGNRESKIEKGILFPFKTSLSSVT